MRRTAALLLALGLALPLACDPPDFLRRLREPQASGLLADERNTIEVFRRTSNSVVFVRNAQRLTNPFNLDASEIERGTGSGFVWDREGHIVTNFHVVRGGNRLSVTLADGSTHDASLVGQAPRKDLAVLAIDPAGLELSPIEIGDSTSLAVGQKVLAIGNPFGLDGSLTTGVISALGRDIRGALDTVIEDVIQTDASINPGNSGGPLLDSGGRLIGITTAIASTTGSSAGVAFAVPAATVVRLMPQLLEHGHVKWAGIGVTLMPDHVARLWGLEGVVVREVLRGSPAERAGLRSIAAGRRGAVRSFDVITEVAGRPVHQAADLIDALDDYDAGEVVNLRFRRDGEMWEANVELAVIE